MEPAKMGGVNKGRPRPDLPLQSWGDVVLPHFCNMLAKSPPWQPCLVICQVSGWMSGFKPRSDLEQLAEISPALPEVVHWDLVGIVVPLVA
eukprot:2197304-Amphidinium_carterae.1